MPKIIFCLPKNQQSGAMEHELFRKRLCMRWNKYSSGGGKGERGDYWVINFGSIMFYEYVTE